MALVSIERPHTAPSKKPDSVVDYVFDWGLFLVSDTITDSELTSSDPALEIVEKVRGAQSLVATVSGGETGKTYCLENKITTSAGEVETQVIRQPVADVAC